MSDAAVWDEQSLDTLLASMESGSRPKGGVRGIADGIPSLGGEHLNTLGSFNFDRVKYVQQSFFDSMKRGHIRRGDVLIVKDGATTGKVSIVREDFPFERAVANEHLFICRPNQSVDGEYLFWFLYSDEGQRRILEHFRGSTQGGITRDFAEGTLVPLAPTRDQQEQIAVLLSAAFKQRMSADGHLTAARRAIQRFRQALLASAFSGHLTANWRNENSDAEREKSQVRHFNYDIKKSDSGLPDLPDSWAWVALGNYAQCSRGRFSVRPRNDPSCFGGEHPFIQIGNLNPDGGWVRSHSQTLNEKGLSVSKKFPAGNAVIAIVGATIGNTGLLAYDMCFPDSLVALETGTLDGNRFVELFLRHRKQDIRNESYSSGGQPNINLEVLNTYPLALPPLAEQSEIVKRVDELLALADSLDARISTAAVRVDRSSHAVLANAFRGKLSVGAELEGDGGY